MKKVANSNSITLL